MTKTETFLKKSNLYTALNLEILFSAKRRQQVIRITEYVLLSIPIIIISSIFFDGYGASVAGETANLFINKLVGLALISLGVYLLMKMFDAYFASIYYFEYVGKNRYQDSAYYTFSTGRILRRVSQDNLLSGFLRSPIGKKILNRLEINNQEINTLLMKQAENKQNPFFDLDRTNILKVGELVGFIFDNFNDFQKLLIDHGVNKKDLEETVNWIIHQIEMVEYNRQWWKPERLARLSGVASDWSFGRTYLLNKYSREIFNDPEVNSDAQNFSNRTREIGQIETVLSKDSGSNVLLVGSPGQEKMEVIWNLAKRIKNKTTAFQLIGKRIILLSTSSFVSNVKNKNDFENQITTVFTEALKAGNIILVIDNLPRLILTAKQFDLNLYEILEPYLSGIGGKIIALADTEYFHTLIENNQAIMSRFEVVLTRDLLFGDIIKIIGQEAFEIEKKYPIIFSYQGILEIAKSADYYFPDGVSSDKAEDLLKELAPWAIANNLDIIGRNEVLNYVSEKTNIPLAKISEIEKDKLLDLENLLMQRVIAQREAVFAIANSIRRGRSGMRNENRPMGSFLFLGPTGVGKTETAKALADVFFGDEKLLLRLDMSEYQNEEALARLIGSIENNSQGILSNMLREHPYGVLLLDEFEKTNKDVLNLFLQIIDEGYFKDVYGKKVMARNIIFVATSNAGAEKIFEIISSGKKLQNHEQEIISLIIKDGLFRPELINRFDATILFHPLTKENLQGIAKIMLKRVAKRLIDKGITFSISNELIKFMADGGYNPTFGARPMNRLIQDTIEEHLANLIIRGQLVAGNTISFNVLSNKAEKDSLKPIVS